jgi:hypothetical protein
MARQRRTHCTASTLARFESSGFLPVGDIKILVYAAPVDNEEALTIALRMPVRILAATPASFNRCGSP